MSTPRRPHPPPPSPTHQVRERYRHEACARVVDKDRCAGRHLEEHFEQTGREHRAEVHLIGFDGELAGARLTIQFVDRLRGEAKFSGPEELQKQLKRDRIAATATLEGFQSVRL
ncbi:MAG: hypothetical protein HC897_10415 [Thermoanaerobaculia bacterium]|nr:hypothetical protein [Thermoanaerobaculia bacterium]